MIVKYRLRRIKIEDMVENKVRVGIVDVGGDWLDGRGIGTSLSYAVEVERQGRKRLRYLKAGLMVQERNMVYTS